MTSFDYCKKCGFQRYVEGYNGPEDYLENGWIMFTIKTEQTDKTGLSDRWYKIEWLCPECAAAETDRQALMEIGSVASAKRGRYGSVVNRRTEGS